MDNDFSIDLSDISSTIRASEVVTLRFVAVGHRLLLDFRTTELDGPMVRVVEPVKSIEERYRSMRRLRPRFAPPEKIVAVWWPRFVHSLKTTGVWDEIMRRVSDTGHVDAVRNAEDALQALIELEAEQQHSAIRGQGFKTLWSRSPTPR
ncbi:MAG: hypothetical protein HYX53_09940 [Chloroflexi bacterium]|nr:hypothetical protein [Chloroflexota bacterium]